MKEEINAFLDAFAGGDDLAWPILLDFLTDSDDKRASRLPRTLSIGDFTASIFEARNKPRETTNLWHVQHTLVGPYQRGEIATHDQWVNALGSLEAWNRLVTMRAIVPFSRHVVEPDGHWRRSRPGSISEEEWVPTKAELDTTDRPAGVSLLLQCRAREHCERLCRRFNRGESVPPDVKAASRDGVISFLKKQFPEWEQS